MGGSSNNIITGNSFHSDRTGIGLGSSSEYNQVENNIIYNELHGILLYGSSNNISNNNITDTFNFAIRASGSSNKISNNFLINNGNYGIIVSGSSNKIWNNYISESLYGMKSDGGTNTRIFHNNFISNDIQAYDRDYNTWNNSYPSGGNYWSDWSSSCDDTYDGATTPQTGSGGPDGICDDEYKINNGLHISDYYPQKNLIDTTPPTISGLEPQDGSIISDDTPLIAADFGDSTDINISAVILKVNDEDVTSLSAITAGGISYQVSDRLAIGSHDVYLEVRDVNDNLATAAWSFSLISLPPTANAGVNIQLYQGENATFNGSGSHDDSGTIANYTWNFTYNEALITIYGVNPSFKFEKVGDYEVYLTVWDSQANSARDTMWVNVSGIDSDGDGLTDYDEENIYRTDPENPDTDSDGIGDGEEIENGTNPLDADFQEDESFSEYLLLASILISISVLLTLIFYVRRKPRPAEIKRDELDEIS
jgi:parallel beta-helix repeat protein